MKIETYLFFDDQCEAAMTFYAKVLGGDIEISKLGDNPGTESLPPEVRQRVMHARLTLSDQTLLASDWHCAPDAPPFGTPFGYRVSLSTGTVAEAERIYGALAENGRTDMPLQETFFAERFGMLVDRFGTPWMIHCEKNT